LAVSKSIGALEEIVRVVCVVVMVFEVPITLSLTQGVWAWNGGWRGSGYFGDLKSLRRSCKEK